MTRSTTGPDAIGAAERLEQALVLRRAGVSYAGIAKEVGYSSKAVAHNAISRYLKRVAQRNAAETAELKAMENQRLDALLNSVWVDAMGGEEGTPVDPKTHHSAVRTAVRITEARTRLNGLAAPSPDEAAEALRLSQQQVAYMEGVLRGVLTGIRATLLSHGLEEHVATLLPVIEGEVIPRALASVATGPDEGEAA